jgi:uncharacterized membrane protein YhiD involved in acid resistance
VLPLGTTALRLSIALVLGAIIGAERERIERAAGIRTHALVCLGSALIIIVSAFGFADILGTRDVVLDPSRIAAQVVSGIGFLGAGAILLRKEVVKGLTTAAGIWLVAGIGLACGAGLLWEAVITAALALVVLAGLRPVERRLFPRRSQHAVRLRVAPSASVGRLIAEAYRVFAEAGVTIDTFELHATRRGQLLEVRCRTADAGALLRAVGPLHDHADVIAIRTDIRGETVAGIERSSKPTPAGS